MNVDGSGLPGSGQRDSPIVDSGRLLFILTTRDAQSAAELATASDQSPAVTARTLGRLIDQGFIVLDDQHGTARYQLRPRAEASSMSVLPRHILLVEEDLLISELVVMVLEDEGYAVVVCLTPLRATALLQSVSFDLVITDSFSQVPSAEVVNAADVLLSAQGTPVALFSSHTLDLEIARASGFSDLITKPFDLDTLVRQVKALLGDLAEGGPAPPRESDAPRGNGERALWPALAS
jgi:two-component system phosphate regulon response regulator PhoB